MTLSWLVVLLACADGLVTRSEVLARARGVGARAAIAPAAAPAVATVARLSAPAMQAFAAGDYARAEALWRAAADAHPSEPLAWANWPRPSSSSSRTNGAVPAAARARRRAAAALRGVVTHCGRARAARARAAPRRPLALNVEGNALALLGRFEAAADAFDAAADAARAARPRGATLDVARENRALALFELGAARPAPAGARSAMRSARRAPRAGGRRRAVRRDPNWADARALLAAARWSAGDARGADGASSRSARPRSPRRTGRPPVPGIGGEELCRYYSSVARSRGAGRTARDRRARRLSPRGARGRQRGVRVGAVGFRAAR